MTINIIGDPVQTKRVMTGLYSFDRAFVNRKGEVGFPVGKISEMFGVSHLGKSTFAYSLSGIIAKELEEGIALADFEGFDPDFSIAVLESVGYSGDFHVIQEESDEDALDKLAKLVKEKYCVGIIDSIGAISPISEQEGSLGEANMGRRAFLMAQFSRKITKVLRENDHKSIFMINHEYPKIGGRGKTTPGGEVKNYLASMRIALKRIYYKSRYEEYPDGSYRIHGTVVKNRWGLKDKEFQVTVLAGHGIHHGLTAMFDAINLGILSRKRTITFGNNSFGYLKDIFNKAHEGDDEFFEPFIELLGDYIAETDISTSVENEENNETDRRRDTEPEDISEEELDNNEDDD